MRCTQAKPETAFPAFTDIINSTINGVLKKMQFPPISIFADCRRTVAGNFSIMVFGRNGRRTTPSIA